MSWNLRAFLQFQAHLCMMSFHHLMQLLHLVGDTVVGPLKSTELFMEDSMLNGENAKISSPNFLIPPCYIGNKNEVETIYLLS